MISYRTSQKPIIGIDVGGTKIAACVVDPRGEILSSIQRPTVVVDPEATLDSISNVTKELLAMNGISINEVDAIGFGIPGLVDAEKGIGIASVNLNWENIQVRAGLENRLGVRCLIDNDVRTGAMGEARFGLGRGLQNLVYLNIGTGVSAVILLDGKILNGANGLAGEIGHAVQIPNGPICKCGGRGCLEVVASGPAIAARAHEKIKSGRKSVMSDEYVDPSQPLTAQKVFKAAANKDSLACETLAEVGQLIAYALQYLALAYDPNGIVIGGGVVQGSPTLNQFIQDDLAELAAESWVFRKIFTQNLVKLSSLGIYAGVLGAAALVAPKFNEITPSNHR